jgi:hypothetical protein
MHMVSAVNARRFAENADETPSIRIASERHRAAAMPQARRI